MELVIKGSEKRIKSLAKEIALRVKRDGSEMSLTESKVEQVEEKQEAEKSPVKKKVKSKK